MNQYQREFIELALAYKALKFGEFTLKSGRKSPYFFNAGEFNSGRAAAALGKFYAQALIEADIPFDMVFGPAYKGIPLATATVCALSDIHQRDLPYGFNRKEAKNHGEGGTLVGAPLQGRVAIVDDVITAGTAIREVLSLIDAHQAKPAAIVVGLNRQEKGVGERSAIQELEHETGVPVVSIVNLSDIITFLEGDGDENTLNAIKDYRDTYGVA